MYLPPSNKPALFFHMVLSNCGRKYILYLTHNYYFIMSSINYKEKCLGGRKGGRKNGERSICIFKKNNCFKIKKMTLKATKRKLKFLEHKRVIRRGI